MQSEKAFRNIIRKRLSVKGFCYWFSEHAFV